VGPIADEADRVGGDGLAGQIVIRGAATAALLAAAALAGGCLRDEKLAISPQPPPPVARPDGIHVLLTPVPINWDDRPGPDGFALDVYFSHNDQDLSVTVSGPLEFMLYEGRLPAGGLAEAKPFCAWAFSPVRLRRHLKTGPPGWGYAMRLGWGDRMPKSSAVTLIARYRPPDGPALLSRPLLVAMRPK
jgi:hypothetical protein